MAKNDVEVAVPSVVLMIAAAKQFRGSTSQLTGAGFCRRSRPEDVNRAHHRISSTSQHPVRHEHDH